MEPVGRDACLLPKVRTNTTDVNREIGKFRFCQSHFSLIKRLLSVLPRCKVRAKAITRTGDTTRRRKSAKTSFTAVASATTIGEGRRKSIKSIIRSKGSALHSVKKVLLVLSTSYTLWGNSQ